MDKRPLLSINAEPLGLWYEGPTWLVAEKPPGMAVHPDSAEGSGTLVNTLLQSNRWLAEMETSIAPGVVHRLRPQDAGLVLVAKDDATANSLREAHEAGALAFRYRVAVPAGVEPRPVADIQVAAQRNYGAWQVYDIDSSTGDTSALAQAWLGEAGAQARFYGYRIEVPSAGEVVASAHRVPLPALDLYTAPPCSVCNTTKAWLSAHGFAYQDHSLAEPGVLEEMKRLAEGRHGIPVVRLGEETVVGFRLQWMKERLGVL